LTPLFSICLPPPRAAWLMRPLPSLVLGELFGRSACEALRALPGALLEIGGLAVGFADGFGRMTGGPDRLMPLIASRGTSSMKSASSVWHGRLLASLARRLRGS
jgi:hypothetical protein